MRTAKVILSLAKVTVRAAKTAPRNAGAILRIGKLIRLYGKGYLLNAGMDL